LRMIYQVIGSTKFVGGFSSRYVSGTGILDIMSWTRLGIRSRNGEERDSMCIDTEIHKRRKRHNHKYRHQNKCIRERACLEGCKLLAQALESSKATCFSSAPWLAAPCPFLDAAHAFNMLRVVFSNSAGDTSLGWTRVLGLTRVSLQLPEDAVESRFSAN